MEFNLIWGVQVRCAGDFEPVEVGKFNEISISK